MDPTGGEHPQDWLTLHIQSVGDSLHVRRWQLGANYIPVWPPPVPNDRNPSNFILTLSSTK